MKKPLLNRMIWILGGAIGGFAWYYFVGCVTGTCPISSNPYSSTGYGALLGALVSGSFSKGKGQTQDRIGRPGNEP